MTITADPTHWVPLPGGSTSKVYRMTGQGQVARVAAPGTNPATLRRHLYWASILTTAGVPVCIPARRDPIPGPDGCWTTLWHDLGDTQPLDYEQVGATVRLFHDHGTAALHGDPDITPVDDLNALRTRLTRARRNKHLTTAEYNTLAPWPNRIANLHQNLPTTGRVLVHDDLWPKNLIQTPHGATLIDLDNLAWGPRDHDLSFIRRAHELGELTDSDVTAFETGYGQPVPDLDTAWAHGYLHRLRWVLDIVERRHHIPEDAAACEQEIPLWASPRGPRG